MSTVVYQPGHSVLHRMPAGLKIICMVGLLVAVAVTQRGWLLAAAALVLIAGYLVARISMSALLSQLWSLRWFLGLLLIFQVLVADWQSALMICGSLAIAICLAGLLTLTTTTTELLDLTRGVLAPLRGRGVDPDRVGLVLAITIRSIPIIKTIIDEVLEARRARGADRSLRAVAVPVVVRCLRSADALGEALIARGVDD